MMRAVAAPRVLNIADLRRLAKRRLPRVVFDYIDGGADAEITLRGNSLAFEALTFRPRCAVVTPTPSVQTKVVGTTLDLPFLLAPVGSSRMFYPRGEAVAARAAGAAGTVYILSTFSGTPMEEVRAASSGPVWYQVYLVGGRDVATAMIDRVKTAGFAALVVTIDTPVAGMRERDLRNGTKELLRGGLSMLPYLAANARPAALARRLSRRWRADEVSQRHAFRRADAVRGGGCRARAISRVLGRPSLDPRAVEGTAGREGRADRR